MTGRPVELAPEASNAGALALRPSVCPTDVPLGLTDALPPYVTRAV